MSGTIHLGFRTAVQLTVEARAAADVTTDADALSGYLPPVENQTLDFDLDNDTVGLPRAATFRSYDASAPYGREESVGGRKGKLPAASIKLPLGELQQLQLQGAGADTIGDALERKARQNGQSIAIRAILARGEAISTGQVTLNENNLTTVVNFGRNAGHSVAATTPWSNPTAQALSEFLAWQTVYRNTNGADAQGVILSSQILAYLCVNEEFIAAAMGTGSSGLNRISPADVRSVLASYGTTDVIVYDGQYKDHTGANVRPIAADRFVLVPPRGLVSLESGPLGTTQWGVPAEALQTQYGISESDRPGVFAGAFSRTDPEGIDVLASAIFLPVLGDPDLTLSADVF